MKIEETERKPVYDLDCNFNYNVMCRASDIASGMCDKCGWNPRVAEKRKQTLRDTPEFTDKLRKASALVKERSAERIADFAERFRRAELFRTQYNAARKERNGEADEA